MDESTMTDAGAVFAEHGLALERLAARITSDREEARDLVADAFAALLAGGPADTAHAVPWMYLTVRHRAYNRLRSQATAQRRLAVLGVEPLEDLPMPVDERIGALLDGAKARLSERDRVAVTLRHLDEAPYDEIATALGTSPAQARVVVHRATRRLRRHVVSGVSGGHGGSACAPGCARCQVVSDEVAALANAPVAALVSRPVGLGERWRELVGWVGRAGERFGDAIGPATAAAAMATAAILPGHAPTADAPSPRALASLTPSALAEPTPALSGSSASPTGGRADPAVPVATPEVRAKAPRGRQVGVTGHITDASDEPEAQAIAQRGHVLLRGLGVPQLVPDPLDSRQGANADIRSLQVATLGDENNRAAGLQARVEFEARPAEQLPIHVAWSYGSGCSSSMEVRSATFSVSCPTKSAAGQAFWSEPVSFARMTVERVDAAVIATVLFADLDDVGRSLLHPGARLSMIADVACDVDSGRCPGDIVPDSGETFDYRVEQ